MIVILAIGNEVVSGQILNRNGQFIAEALSKRGFTVFAQNAVRDEIDTIKSAFKEAFNKADILIATGGLGPTIDDLTKEAAALYFNSGIHLDEKIKAELIERFKGKVHSVDNQA
ncbi:MAG: molybdopterin-binding protein, partial [Parachlamydiaceae bacterium]